MKGLSRVLVTGGAGFIGSHLVPRLLEKHYSVVVLDNLSTGQLRNLPKKSENRDFAFRHGDIRDKVAVADAMCEIDAVIHLAAVVGVQTSIADPVQTHDINTTGTMNMLQEARRQDVRRFVFASSAAVYGDGNPLPLKEDYALRPLSPYGASKVAGESYCRCYTECYGLSSVNLRFFNIYGPGSEHSPYSGVVTNFLTSILHKKMLTVFGDGAQTRDFLNVEDVVDAVILALEKEKLKSETFNVCSGEPTSVNRLVEILRKVTGKQLEVRHDPERKGEIKHSYGDSKKADFVLGFRSRTTMEKGLESFLKAMK